MFVKSLPGLINYLRPLNPSLERQLKASIDAERTLLDKYFSFRHKIYAHRDKAKSPQELFGKVPKRNLKREMEAIVRLSRNTVCTLAEASGVERKDDMAEAIRLRGKYAGMDANQILKVLEKHSR